MHHTTLVLLVVALLVTYALAQKSYSISSITANIQHDDTKNCMTKVTETYRFVFQGQFTQVAIPVSRSIFASRKPSISNVKVLSPSNTFRVEDSNDSELFKLVIIEFAPSTGPTDVTLTYQSDDILQYTTEKNAKNTLNWRTKWPISIPSVKITFNVPSEPAGLAGTPTDQATVTKSAVTVTYTNVPANKDIVAQASYNFVRKCALMNEPDSTTIAAASLTGILGFPLALGVVAFILILSIGAIVNIGGWCCGGKKTTSTTTAASTVNQ